MNLQGLLALLLALAAGSSVAQSTVTRYYADECSVMPKEILVAPYGLSYIEFHDTIDPGQVFSPGVTTITQGSQDDLDSGLGPMLPFTAVHSEGSNLMNISTSLNKAETVMVVWVKGEPCNLVLRVKEGLNGPQRYIIEAQRPLPALNGPGELDTSDLQDEVEFEILNVSAPSDGNASAFFTLTNHSSNVVAADIARIRFEQDGTRYATEVKKEPVRQLVQPGETQTGYILLKGVTPGPGQLSWTMREIKGMTREVTFRENLDVPAR